MKYVLLTMPKVNAAGTVYRCSCPIVNAEIKKERVWHDTSSTGHQMIIAVDDDTEVLKSPHIQTIPEVAANNLMTLWQADRDAIVSESPPIKGE